MNGRGINTGFDDSRFEPGIGQITDTNRVTGSKATAFGLMAGIQFGSGSFRFTPYAFLDSVRVNTKAESTFIVPGFVNSVTTGSAKRSARVFGAGIKTSYFFTETFGISADLFAGQLTGGLKADGNGIKPDSGGRYAIGGKMAVSAKF